MPRNVSKFLINVKYFFYEHVTQLQRYCNETFKVTIKVFKLWDKDAEKEL